MNEGNEAELTKIMIANIITEHRTFQSVSFLQGPIINYHLCISLMLLDHVHQQQQDRLACVVEGGLSPDEWGQARVKTLQSPIIKIFWQDLSYLTWTSDKRGPMCPIFFVDLLLVI